MSVEASVSQREYRVWVKGFKLSSGATRRAESAELARIRYAAERGVKSYQVEAVWNRDATNTEDEDNAPRCITTGQHRNDGRGMCIDCDYVMAGAA